MPTGNNSMDMIDRLDERDGTDYEFNDPINDGDDNEDDELGSSEDTDAEDDGSNQSDDEISEEPRQTPRKSGKDANEPEANRRNAKPNPANVKQPNQEEIRRLPNGLHQDTKGNLVDPRDGTIIARAGSERRLFEKNMRMQSEITTRDTRITDLNRQIADVNFLNGIPKQYGLSTEDVQRALALSAVFKQNPIEAAKSVLEMVLAQGHNITDILGDKAENAIEMRAVQQMLDQRLAPLTERQKAEREATEARTRAEDGLNKFIADHEYSDVHLVELDRLMGSNPDLTPERAYYELRLFSERNGLDFSQPLGPQIARQSQGNRGARNGNRNEPPRTQTRSMPNGRSAPTTVRNMSDTDQYNPRDSWDDILRQVMPNV